MHRESLDLNCIEIRSSPPFGTCHSGQSRISFQSFHIDFPDGLENSFDYGPKGRLHARVRTSREPATQVPTPEVATEYVFSGALAA